MKKFKFRFQAVLNVRKDHEERHKRELGDLNRLKAAQERRLMGLAERRKACEEEARRQISSGTHVAQAARHGEYLRWVCEEIERQKAVVADVEHKTEQKRQELVEAAKERRMMERLLDRDHRDFMMRVERSQQAFLDELSLNRHARTMPGREESHGTP